MGWKAFKNELHFHDNKFIEKFPTLILCHPDWYFSKTYHFRNISTYGIKWAWKFKIKGMRKGWRGMLEEPLRNNSLYPVASQPLNITHILKSPFPFAKNFLWRSFASLTNWKKKKKPKFLNQKREHQNPQYLNSASKQAWSRGRKKGYNGRKKKQTEKNKQTKNKALSQQNTTLYHQVLANSV